MFTLLLLKDVQCAEDLLKVIKLEMSELQHSKVGKKDDWKANGCFKKFQAGDNRCVYVYCHSQHAACSSVLLSDLERMRLAIDKSRARLLKCTKHHYHDDLQPFYLDNDRLLEYYEVALSEGRNEVKPQAELLKNILAGKQPVTGTDFECPKFTSNNWSENDWTKRLVRGIEKTLPQVNVTFSATMGLTFSTDLLSRLRVDASEKYFLFRGAPDIIIHSGSAVISHSASDTTTEGATEDEAIENCHQRPPLSGWDNNDPPEKIGELFAALHILLVCKILRKVTQGMKIHRRFEVKGLLVDKMHGIMHCSLYVVMGDGASTLKLDMKDYMGSMLWPESLCYHIRAIANREFPA
jgi:hypothetical protein